MTIASRPPEPAAADAAHGRFVVTRQAQLGDVGLVEVAFDTVLGREVALRTLGALEPGPAREVQAQARLAHPNVLRILEVVRPGGRAIAVMEWTVGETLAAWRARQRQPGWRGVLAHFVAAGAGLGAAHEAGLVHGRFTADSALVGGDGRVRVLAVARALREGAAPGEPLVGGELAVSQPVPEDRVFGPGDPGGAGTVGGDPTDDLRAFCAALDAALRGVKAPGWLRRVIARGSARGRAGWTSMADLLAGLRADAARARRRRAAAVVLGAAIVAGTAGLVRNLAAGARCDPDAQLVGVWDAARKQAVEDALLATGLPMAPDVWRRVEARLDVYASQWTGLHAGVCASRGSGDRELLVDRSAACLARRRASLAALTEVLGEADGAVVLRAISAADSLPSLAACADPEALRAAAPPPEDPARAAAVERLRGLLTRAKAYEDAGKPAQGLAVTDAVLAEAARIGYGPLLAEARLQEGRLLLDAGRDGAAEALATAAWEALDVRLDDLAAEALARRVYALGGAPARRAELAADAALAEALVRRIGERGRWIAGELRNNLGAVYGVEGSLEAARRAFEEAMAIKAEVFGRDSPQYAYSLGNLGFVLDRQGRLPEARRYYLEAMTLLRASLGPHHPHVAIGLNNLASTHARAGEWALAGPYAEAYLAALASAFPGGVELVEPHLFVARIALEQGHVEAARRHVEAAQSLARRRGDEAGLVRALVARGHVELRAGAVEAAEAAHAEVAARPLDLRRDDDLRLTALRFGLARALIDRPDAEARARALAVEAEAGYRAAGEAGRAGLAEVSAWMQAHPAAVR